MTFTASIKTWAMAQQEGRCKHCNIKLKTCAYEFDHIKPLCKGGVSTRANCQALCKKCHKKKTGRERKRGLYDLRIQTIRYRKIMNPKKEGTRCRARYNLYKKAKTVFEFKKCGGLYADLKWDINHGYATATYK